VDNDMDDFLDRTIGFAVVLMNSTPPWTRQLGLPHHPDDQAFHLGQFTTWDLVYSAYHQAGDNHDLPDV